MGRSASENSTVTADATSPEEPQEPADIIAQKRLVRERKNLLRTISTGLDTPMTILSFGWLILLIIDFTGGMNDSLQTLSHVIWAIFIVHFIVEFWIAPFKLEYLQKNWLTALALVLPAFRMLRAFRAMRFLRAVRIGRSVRLLRWVTSMNRGMKATRRTLQKRGFSYIMALTVIVCFAGAAGIYVFERPEANPEPILNAANGSTAPGIGSYPEAVWWTAMMLTTMGSDYFPRSAEGRIIAWLLAVYAFAIFGYITATVASHIIKVDHQQNQKPRRKERSTAAKTDEIHRLQQQLQELNVQLQAVMVSLQRQPPGAEGDPLVRG